MNGVRSIGESSRNTSNMAIATSSTGRSIRRYISVSGSGMLEPIPKVPQMMGALPIVLLSNLNEMRGNEELCDIVVKTGEAKFPVHKVVLAAISPYFRTLFSSSFDSAKESEIEIPEADVNSLDSTLKFIYTGKLQDECTDLISVLELAEFLQISCLKCICCEKLKTMITEQNCERVYKVAQLLQLNDLHDAAKRFMYHNGLSDGVHKQFCHKIVLVAGGGDWSGQSLRSAECLTKLNGNLRWRHTRPPLAEIESSTDTLSVMDHSRIAPAFVSTPTHLYCIGGYFLDTVESYSLSTNKWKQHARMPLILRGAAAAFVNGNIWVIGGANIQDWDDRVWIYNLRSNSWHQGPSLPEKRIYHSAVTWHNMIYVIGGKTEGDLGASRSLLMLAPGSNQWLNLASMSRTRSNFGCTVAHGCIYAIGGADGISTISDCERYNLVTNQWRNISKYSTPVEGCRAATLINKAGEETVICIGGSDGMEVLNRVSRLGVSLNEWHIVPELNTPRSSFAVGVFPKYT